MQRFVSISQRKPPLMILRKSLGFPPTANWPASISVLGSSRAPLAASTRFFLGPRPQVIGIIRRSSWLSDTLHTIYKMIHSFHRGLCRRWGPAPIIFTSVLDSHRKQVCRKSCPSVPAGSQKEADKRELFSPALIQRGRASILGKVNPQKKRTLFSPYILTFTQTPKSLDFWNIWKFPFRCGTCSSPWAFWNGR